MALSPSMRLGPYEIQALLGAGGMGDVYRARDTRLGREVAIKVLPTSVAADPDRLRRFEQEARAASALNHPNVLTIYDIGEAGGTVYIASELVAGETLRARCARGPLAVPEIQALAGQIASGLGAAHAAGVVHRDLKPDNVMIRPDGLVKLLDFGLAKLTVAADAAGVAATMAGPQTALGSIAGTVRYMSPEQARGQAVDARSDVFSFGVVLYELLAGRVPHDGATSTDVLVAVLQQRPAPVSDYRADTPPDLQALVARCLEKDPHLRPASATEVAAALSVTARTPAAPAVPADSNQTPSVAVLPFVNMSADPENEYFCDGLAEELINALGKIDQLRVVGRTSVFAHKGQRSDVHDIGRALNVSAVLDGSVRKAGTRIRITAQLIDVGHGYQLWSERYDRQLEDVFEIQDEISLAIVEALKVKLLGGEKSAVLKRATTNPEAYQLYLKGRHHWHKWTEEGLRRSREYFEGAIAVDSQYAMAYYGLADSYLASGSLGRPIAHILPPAKAALARALEIDPRLAGAWALLGVCHLYEWDWAASDRAVLQAIEIDPRSSHAHLGMASHRLYHRRFDEALAASLRSLELEPLAPLWNWVLARVYRARREYDRASEQTRVLLEIAPDWWMAHHERAMLLHSQGSTGGAIEALEHAVRSSGRGPLALGYLAWARARAGERAAAEQIVAELSERSTAEFVPAFSLAVAYAGLERSALAFDCLERACQEQEIWLILDQFNPTFASLVADPRLADVLRRVGLPAWL